jgi:hypothetical protein
MSDYDTDVYAWSQRQGTLLRRLAAGERVNDADLDWPNIAEEIETVGRSEREAVASRIATIIEHLIKLQASPATEPRAGWENTIDRARGDVERLLRHNPSIRRQVQEMIDEELPTAQRLAARALVRHNEVPKVEPQTLSYSESQVLNDWYPDVDARHCP